VCNLFHAEFHLLTPCGTLSLSTTSLCPCSRQPRTHHFAFTSRAPRLCPVLLAAASRASCPLHTPPHRALVTARAASPCTPPPLAPPRRALVASRAVLPCAPQSHAPPHRARRSHPCCPPRRNYGHDHGNNTQTTGVLRPPSPQPTNTTSAMHDHHDKPWPPQPWRVHSGSRRRPSLACHVDIRSPSLRPLH